MSIVRYKKKNGSIAVYESTSYYDPDLKQSRPKRKYLGMEDPVTHKLIPSSKKRGKRKKSDIPSAGSVLIPQPASQEEIKSLRAENIALRKENEILRKENKSLHDGMNAIISIAKKVSASK